MWFSNSSLLHEPPPDVNDEDSLSPVASRSGSPTLYIDMCESPPASDPGYSATSSSEGKYCSYSRHYFYDVQRTVLLFSPYRIR